VLYWARFFIVHGMMMMMMMMMMGKFPSGMYLAILFYYQVKNCAFFRARFILGRKISSWLKSVESLLQSVMFTFSSVFTSA